MPGERTIGVVLAGGRSDRFGSPKGLATLGGRPLIEWVLAAHRSVLSEVVVVVADIPSPYDGLGVSMLLDGRSGAGPLAGLQAGLSHASAAGARGVFCTSCDTPFIVGTFIRALLAESYDVDAVIPRGSGSDSLEPLFGWYSTRVLAIVETCLDEGVRAVHRVADRIERKRIFSIPDLPDGLDPEMLFHNVNTPADLEWAAARLGAEPSIRR